MCKTYSVIGALSCLLVSLCVSAGAGENTRKLVLPNPQLIHCHSANCSQLWKQDSNDGGAVYPAQVLTDVADGEVIGLTAVYDKSVSLDELRDAINTLYRKWLIHGQGLWRVEPEQLAIQIADGSNGAKELIYVKFGAGVPSAHIDCSK